MTDVADLGGTVSSLLGVDDSVAKDAFGFNRIQMISTLDCKRFVVNALETAESVDSGSGPGALTCIPNGNFFRISSELFRPC